MGRFLLGILASFTVTYLIGCWLASQILNETDQPTHVMDRAEIGVTTSSDPTETW